MTTITLDLPDQLVADIEPIREELPVLLAITRQLFRPADETQAHRAQLYLAYKQFLDFLALAPSSEEISRFVISPQAQARIEELLDKHGKERLTTEEAAELRVYTQIYAVMGVKKAEAALALAQLAG